MSSTGATLSGSFAGATGAVSDTGFWYGASQNNLQTDDNKVSSGSTDSPFSKAISGLTANTTYYYQAWVAEYNAQTSSVEIRAGAVESFKTKSVATSIASVSDASNVTKSSATLNGAFSGATGTVSAYGFYYGTATNEITTQVITNSAPSSNFSYNLTGLTANTTYYFKSFVVEYDENAGASMEHVSTEYLSFKTLQAPLPGYLGCYEIPEVILANYNKPSNTGSETFGNTNWYEHDASVSTRKIVTHTYEYNSKVYRNYTAMVDQNKRCALWTAYPMHANAYPLSTGVGRDGSFNTNTSYDPAIPSAWQSSGSTSDYNNGNGYARGHHCASADRQATDAANNQTFYYTNQSPQWQNNFNSGVWSSLEGRVQNQAPTGRDTLYVVVGTLFENGNTGSSNDGGTVARPSHFYKCLMKCSFNTSGTMTAAQGIAFIYTNEAHTGNYYDSAYVTSINAIEDRAGFNFFAAVPDNLEDSAESNTNHTWFTGQSSPSNVAPVGDNNWGSL